MTENNKPPVESAGCGDCSGAGGSSPDCEVVMVYATFPSVDAASETGRALVEGRLAGCINILPGMISIYPWEGKIESTTEAVMIAKTIVSRSRECVDFIRSRHAYDIPAVLTLPVIGGSEDYLKWLRAGVAAKF